MVPPDHLWNPPELEGAGGALESEPPAVGGGALGCVNTDVKGEKIIAGLPEGIAVYFFGTLIKVLVLRMSVFRAGELDGGPGERGGQ